MCQVTLSAVTKVCGPNVPGNINLYVANQVDTTVPAATDKVVSTDVTMESGTQFFQLAFDRKSCQHTEERNENGQVTGTIEAFCSHDDATKRNLFENMVGGEFAVIVEDGNNLAKIAENVEFTASFDSGKEGNDKNGYTITFSYEGTSANIYEGVVPLTPAA